MSTLKTTWRIFCEACQTEKEQSNPAELVFVHFDDGNSQGLSACAKCAKQLKAHMDEVAEEDAKIDAAKAKSFETREDVENRGFAKMNQPPVKKAADQAAEVLQQPNVMELLTAIAGNQAAMSENLKTLTQRVASLEDAPKGKRSKA